MLSLGRRAASVTAAVLALVAATLPALATAGSAAAAPSTAPSSSSPTPATETPVALCSDAPGRYQCLAERLPVPVAAPPRSAVEPGATATPALARAATRAPAFSDPTQPGFRGYTPADLAAVYDIPASTSTATVAIVDAYDNPDAEANLAYYRAHYGLPACTTANGCFAKVNQAGDAGPLPVYDAGWAGEIDLDLQMVSAACPSCHLLLVEADSADSGGAADMEQAVATAARLGAGYISMSWGSGEYSLQTAYDRAYLSDPAVTYVASAGDSGYGASWPAISPNVIAVGGTALDPAPGTARGWTESVWGSSSGTGAGSGCSLVEPQPAWQAADAVVAGACSRRVANDLSIVGDPHTGVSVYSGGAWTIFGGTSVGAPLIAGMYAAAGQSGGTRAAAGYAYGHAAGFHDVTTGSNGTCDPALLCTAAPGWDGPSGLGTPDGLAALTDTGTGGAPDPTNPTDPSDPTAGAPAPPSSTTVTIAAPANLRTRAGRAVTTAARATDSDPTQTLRYRASGLPAGTRIAAGTGVISGRPRGAGVHTVTVTATDGAGASASARFRWTVLANRLVAVGRARVAGGRSLGDTLRAAGPAWHLNTRTGAAVYPRLRYQWLANGRPVSGWQAQRSRFTIPTRRGWLGVRISVRITASARYCASSVVVPDAIRPTR